MTTVAQCLARGSKTSWRETLFEWRSSRYFVIGVVCFAGMTDMLLYGLIVTVVPTALSEKVKLPEGEQQRWTSILLALYGAATTVCSLICGYLVDRAHARRWPFVAGLAVLAVATALLCIGSHLSLWILGRLLQGGAAAVVWTVGMALLVDRFQEDALGNALGYAAMSTVIGSTAGPLLGGALYEHAGYYAPFGFAFGVIGLDLVLRLMVTDKRKHETTAHTDVEVSHMTAEKQDPADGENPPAAATASGGDGVSVSGRTDPAGSNSESTDSPSRSLCQPQKPGTAFELLRSPRMILTLSVYVLVSAATTAFDSVLPLFVRDTFGWKQTAQGLIFIPLMAPHILDPVIGYILDRWPKTRCYLAAMALFAMVPLLTCLRYVTENTIDHKVLLCVLLGLIGLCIGLVETPITVEVVCLALESPTARLRALSGDSSTALACGLCNSAFAAGSLAGPFLGGFIRDYASWATMSWALAVPMGVCGILVLAFLR